MDALFTGFVDTVVIQIRPGGAGNITLHHDRRDRRRNDRNVLFFRNACKRGRTVAVNVRRDVSLRLKGDIKLDLALPSREVCLDKNGYGIHRKRCFSVLNLHGNETEF